MEKIVRFGKSVIAITTEYACIAYFAVEKYAQQYLVPCINKMKLHCWIGAIALLALGWLAAKIF